MFFKIFAAATLLVQVAVAAAVAATTYKNMAYYANWDVYTAFQPQQLNVAYMTHVLYAFADIAPNGEVISSDPYADYQMLLAGDKKASGTNAYGNIKQLYIHKKKNRKLKTLLSIGGFSNSQMGKFAAASNTTAGRQRFAKSAVKLMADWGFDGIDIDWEYPASTKEGANFVLLLKECRGALRAYANAQKQSYHYLLTVPTSAGPSTYKYLDLKGINTYCDSVHLMAYDYSGSWDTVAGHQANLKVDPNNPKSTPFSTEKALSDYLAKGVSARKIMLGMPLYGRSFANTKGPGQSFKGTGKGSVEPGVWQFKDLPRPGASVATIRSIGAMYTYDSKTKELVSCDGAATTNLKATWLKSKGLGGAFFWEAAGDKTGTSSLIRTMAVAVKNLESSNNQLSYPASPYANIKAGMPGA